MPEDAPFRDDEIATSSCPDCGEDVIEAIVLGSERRAILLNPDWLGENVTAEDGHTFELNACGHHHHDNFARPLSGFEAEARRDTYAEHVCAG